MSAIDHSANGVGLKLTNLPTDIKKFNWVLAQQGCHPKAAARIIERINKKGYDLLTVQNSLEFDWIKNELEQLGVIMEFIKPLKNWTQKHEDGEWPEEALPDRFKKKLVKI